jgi:hypothetical protein
VPIPVMESHVRYALYARFENPYNGCVADPCFAFERTPDEPNESDPVELAARVRAKLNAAIQLACQAEHERRSCRWESAEVYQRQWEDVMDEVKRLLPLVRKNGVSLFATGNRRS